MRSRRQPVRILFLAAVPFLLLQFAFARVYEEPYPAIVLPAFGSAPKQSGRLQTTEWALRVSFQDGSSKAISRDDFLRGAANSHREFIMRLNFASGGTPDTDRSHELREWTLDRCRTLTGRRDVAALLVETSVITRSDARSPAILARETRDKFVMELQ